MGLKTTIRGHSIQQVEKRMKDLQKRGYKSLMDEPKLDPGSSPAHKIYVMEMEHPTLKRTGTKTWL